MIFILIYRLVCKPLLPLIIYPLVRHTVGPLDPVTCKEAALFTVYEGLLSPRVAVVLLFFNILLCYRLGPLDPVTCKEAAPLYWLY